MNRRRTGWTATCLAALAVSALAVATAPVASAAAARTTITGTVTGDGHPLQNVDVGAVALPADGTGPYTVASATTNAAGKYRMTVSQRDDLRIQFTAARAVGGTSATGYSDLCSRSGPICTTTDPTVTLVGTSSKVVSATLPRAGVLRGRVVDSLGRGVGGLSITLTSDYDQGRFLHLVAPTSTDLNGNYAFPRLDPTAYGLEVGYVGDSGAANDATPGPHGYGWAFKTVSVAAGDQVRQTSRVVGGGVLDGVVRDQSGMPVVGAFVTWAPTIGGNSLPQGTTDADGSFSLGARASNVSGRLCASADGFKTACIAKVAAPEFTASNLTVVMHRIS